MRPFQYSTPVNPYKGLATSVITSNPLFLGDAAMITGSWITSAATASRLTLMGYEGEAGTGFTSALPAPDADGWKVVKTQTATGYFSVDTIPMWGRFMRDTGPSSAATLFLTIHVGP